jgi:hypothetical protein
VAGKHKTIQFTVTCVMITIVQKTVILKSMLDHGRSFSCHLSSYFSSVIPRASCTYNKYLRSSDRNFVYLLIKETLELYHVLAITSSTHQQLILSTKREPMSVLYISPRAYGADRISDRIILPLSLFQIHLNFQLHTTEPA